MSRLLSAFDNLIPAGTALAAPVTFNMVMPPGIVDTIQVRIPPGPNGTMGFSIGAAGQPVIPVNAGQWIVASDQFFTWDLTHQIESGAWQMLGYNTGIYDHTVYIEFLSSLINDVPSTQTGTPLAILGTTG